MAKHQKTNQTSVVPATPADGSTTMTTTTNQSPASSNFLSLTGSDIEAMSFSQLDAFVKARRNEVTRYGSETKKILKTLTPVIVRMHELLSNQGKRTDLPDTPEGLTWEEWMKQHKSLASPSTFYRILREAKALLPQVGDAFTTPDNNIAKILHLHSTAPDKVDVEEMPPNTDKPIVKTYNLDQLKAIKPKPVYIATTPHGWDVDVAVSGAHKSMRRGDEVNGVYWIKELYFTNAEGRCRINVWKQIFIYACEDIGLADLTVKTQVLGLHQKAEIKRHVHELEQITEFCKGGTHHPDLLMVVEAMMLCCRAEKSRAVDNAIIYFNENPTYMPPTENEVEFSVQTKQPKPVVTDDGPIYDKHTKHGRNKLGRKSGSKIGEGHFKYVGAHLENKSKVADFQAPTDNPRPHSSDTEKVPD